MSSRWRIARKTATNTEGGFQLAPDSMPLGGVQAVSPGGGK